MMCKYPRKQFDFNASYEKKTALIGFIFFSYSHVGATKLHENHFIDKKNSSVYQRQLAIVAKFKLSFNWNLKKSNP